MTSNSTQELTQEKWKYMFYTKFYKEYSKQIFT